jgi:hypothetical protein
MPLGEKIENDMNSVHEKFHEFSIQGDINLSLFSLAEIWTRNIMAQGYLNTWKWCADTGYRKKISFIFLWAVIYYYEFLNFADGQVC